jgi:hypothetical protein
MSSLPPVKEDGYSTYWQLRYEELWKGHDGYEDIETKVNTMMGFLGELQMDYTTICTRLEDRVHELQDENARLSTELATVQNQPLPATEDNTVSELLFQHSSLAQEVLELRGEIHQLRTAQAAAPPPLPAKAPESTSGPAPPEPSPSPPAPPTPAVSTWAQVARKQKKKNTTATGKPAPAAATTPPTAKAPSPKKGPTLRERRLIIKRDGTPLTTTPVTIRDSINTALNATLIQRVEANASHDLMFTTMDSVKATSLNSKISQFLHLIPGTTTVHLDSPTAQLLVHGISTSHSLSTIGKELTTFNTGLALATQPRWLIPDDKRAGRKASTIVITATGPKAQEFAQQPRLAAFSSTFRIERRLRFSKSTQCFNCHQFGHHTLKCTNPPSCRWCAKPHSTGDHTCPTATCPMRGRLCAHASPVCAVCGGPHEAHSTKCAKRPNQRQGNLEEEDDDAVQMVDT